MSSRRDHKDHGKFRDAREASGRSGGIQQGQGRSEGFQGGFPTVLRGRSKMVVFSRVLDVLRGGYGRSEWSRRVLEGF